MDESLPAIESTDMSNSKLSALALIPFLFASCGHSSQRTVVVSNPTIHEIEPNNTAFQPDAIGPVGLGSYFQIDGSIEEFGSPFSYDEYDGFAFYVEDAVEIEFVLHAHNPFADLDVWIYDPYNNEYIAQFESASSPEYGRVTFPYLGEEFHVVVTSYSGNSSYTLEVIAHPLYGAFSAAVEIEEAEPSLKDEARMKDYLKPELRSAPVTLIQIDRENGQVRTFSGLAQAAE